MLARADARTELALVAPADGLRARSREHAAAAHRLGHQHVARVVALALPHHVEAQAFPAVCNSFVFMLFRHKDSVAFYTI